MKKVTVIAVVIVILALGVWIFARDNGKAPAPSNIQTTQTAKQTPMQITSPAFAQGQGIPKKYSCDGEGVNPPLQFKDVPQNAQSLALIMDDPDAPMGTWIHWTLWNINPTAASIAENTSPTEAVAGKTSSGLNAYGGPCPPNGQHRYYFKLYALDAKLSIPARSDVDELKKAMEGHVIGQAELMGTYSR